MTITQNVAVTVLRAIGQKGFGFLSVAAGETEVFVTESHLLNFGFAVDVLKVGQSAIVDYKTMEDGRRRVVKIHSVDGQIGKAMPSVAKSAKPVESKAPPKKWQFYTSTQVDTHKNKRLVKVCEIGSTTALQYVIFTKEDDGRETSQLLSLGTNAFEARKLLGKEVVVRVCKGHGVKTNVPKQLAAADKKAEKKKKAA